MPWPQKSVLEEKCSFQAPHEPRLGAPEGRGSNRGGSSSTVARRRRQLEAAAGLQMTLQQNRGAALSVEPKIEQVVSWFTAERSIDRAAPAKLWDGSAWHRTVMDKTRAQEKRRVAYQNQIQ
eukprot:Skav234735  [mRNA]  locus=scaffold634:893499:894472:- [translate_table: standard]